MMDKKKRKVIFCCPTISRPYAPFLSALEASIPLIRDAGWDEGSVYEVGNPYISAARSIMLRKACDAQADVIVFLDHDLSWKPADLLKLIETEGDVVAGTYRFKDDAAEDYMGELDLVNGKMIGRADGCLRASRVPAGFLKITTAGLDRFIKAYPHLCYGSRFAPSVDLFNHGAHDNVWWGEDYAFSRNYIAAGGEIWLIPDLDIVHHNPDGAAFPGNLHQFLMRQPGGINDPNRAEPVHSVTHHPARQREDRPIWDAAE